MSQRSPLERAQRLVLALPAEPRREHLADLDRALAEAAADGADADAIAERCGISIRYVLRVLGEPEEGLRDRGGRSMWVLWTTESGQQSRPG